MGTRLKITLSLLLCIVVGMIVTRLALQYWPAIKQHVWPNTSLYSTSNTPLKSAYTNANITPLNWAMLLPQSEKQTIGKYQAKQAQNLEGMTAQILRSIQASSDQDYQQALSSTNTIDRLDNKMVTISGFIVPIDFYEDKSVQHLFIVPYFGACLHFPPPPPNQMIFTRLEPGFSELDITQAYTLNGKINQGLFEDPMGTSAYILDTVSIDKFYGQPDDFRKH